MTRSRRTKAQIVEAIFQKLDYEKEPSLWSFRKLGLNKHSIHDFINVINCISQQINGTDLIEVVRGGGTTIIRLHNGSSTISNQQTNIIRVDYQKSDIVQAIENAISKLAFKLQTGELARKQVTTEKLEEAERINEGYQNYLSKKENNTLGTLIKQKEKSEMGAVFAELKKSKVNQKAKVEGE